MASRIVVLGGGISGLSAAYILARGLARSNVTAKVMVLDRGNLGGWMQSEDTGKAIFDLGPHSFRTVDFLGLHTLRLVDDLGLAEDITYVTRAEAANQDRYLYVNKQLNKLQMNFSALLRPQPPLTQSFASIYLKNIFKKFPPGGETVYEAFSGKFGEEVTRYHVDAFVRGVFAADIKELSLKAAFPAIWKQFKSSEDSVPRKPSLPDVVIRFNEFYGDLLNQAQKEKWTQCNFDGGMRQFIDGLEAGCSSYGVDILKNTTATQVSLREDGKMSIMADFKDDADEQQARESLLEVDHVISALPAHNLSKVLLNGMSDSNSEKQKILHDIGSKLKEIKAADVGVVNLEFEGSPQDILPNTGFGHLVPSCEESKVLGIIYDSCVFSRHDRKDFPSTRLTCMMGGSWFEELFGDPEKVKDRDLEQAALESVSEQLGITKDPTTAITTLSKKCIPTYRRGHTDLVENMEDLIFDHELPLSLGGASYWGVSVNDCIYNSRIIADRLTSKLQKK